MHFCRKYKKFHKEFQNFVYICIRFHVLEA